jgi:hypothetical protein
MRFVSQLIYPLRQRRELIATCVIAGLRRALALEFACVGMFRGFPVLGSAMEVGDRHASDFHPKAANPVA